MDIQYKNALGVKSSKTNGNRLIKSIIPLSNQCSRNQQKSKTRTINIKKESAFLIVRQFSVFEIKNTRQENYSIF